MAEPTVLVVDDDVAITRFLADVVAAEFPGARVLVAPDGATALELARAEVPQVVLLDWMLPGMRGDDVARALRADLTLAGTAVVGISAAPGGGPMMDALCDAFMRKPFDLPDLLSVLSRYLGPGAAGS